MGIAVHPGDIVSPDDNGAMVMPKATSGGVVKIAVVRDEKETGVVRPSGRRRHSRAFRDETPATEAGRAPFRADGTGKRELVVMKGGRTVSSGKSIAHILHHLIGAKIAGRVILLDGGRVVESERDGKPSPLSYRAGAGNVWIRSSSRPGSPRKTNLMHGIGPIEGRFNSISCGLGKSTPRRAQPEDRSVAVNLADARGQRRFGPSHQPQVAP